MPTEVNWLIIIKVMFIICSQATKFDSSLLLANDYISVNLSQSWYKEIHRLCEVNMHWFSVFLYYMFREN